VLGRDRTILNTYTLHQQEGYR